MNDITNCLRRGDLTAIRHGDRHVQVGLMEVKASKEASAESRQVRRLDEAVQLVNAGEVVTVDGGEELRIIRVPTPYRTYLANLADTVRQARRTSIAWMRPAPSMAVCVLDYNHAARIGASEMLRRAEQERDELGWFDGPEQVAVWSEIHKRIRDRHDSVSALAPLSIFPLPEEDVADLMLGFVERVTYLHLGMFERLCASRGIAARSMLPQMFMEATSGTVRVVAPPAVGEQIGFELMTPANAIAAIEHQLYLTSQAPSPERKSIVVMENERRVWDR